MAPSTTGTSSRPTRAAKKKAPAPSAAPISSATSTSAGGRKTQKQVATTESTKVPSKCGRKPTSTSAVSTATKVAATMAKTASASGIAGISAEDLAFYNRMTIQLAAANKAQKEAADLGAVVLFCFSYSITDLKYFS